MPPLAKFHPREAAAAPKKSVLLLRRLDGASIGLTHSGIISREIGGSRDRLSELEDCPSDRTAGPRRRGGSVPFFALRLSLFASGIPLRDPQEKSQPASEPAPPSRKWLERAPCQARAMMALQFAPPIKIDERALSGGRLTDTRRVAVNQYDRRARERERERARASTSSNITAGDDVDDGLVGRAFASSLASDPYREADKKRSLRATDAHSRLSSYFNNLPGRRAPCIINFEFCPRLWDLVGLWAVQAHTNTCRRRPQLLPAVQAVHGCPMVVSTCPGGLLWSDCAYNCASPINIAPTHT